MNLNELRPVYISLNEPKAKMGLNEPKWAQKILNISQMVLYELQIGPNEFKYMYNNKYLM